MSAIILYFIGVDAKTASLIKVMSDQISVSSGLNNI